MESSYAGDPETYVASTITVDGDLTCEDVVSSNVTTSSMSITDVTIGATTYPANGIAVSKGGLFVNADGASGYGLSFSSTYVTDVYQSGLSSLAIDGTISVVGDPSGINDVTRKSYVDTNLDTKVTKTGDEDIAGEKTFSGPRS